jgi:tRNA-splicing ligase RtcB
MDDRRGWKGQLNKLSEYKFEIPKTYKAQMRTSGIVYADDKMIDRVRADNSLEQVANVATLPGIVGQSMAMPDIHWGYGFPIGGVAAMSEEDGVISPGGVGYDINCGVRLLRTDLELNEVQPKIKDLIDTVFMNVPSGVGSKGKVRLNRDDLENVLAKGAKWAVDHSYGWSSDPENLEQSGCLDMADPSEVSQKAKDRGMPQLGSLGAGNHFLEVQKVDKIFEPEIAKSFGITGENQVVTMIHTGSRGCGHQIASDSLGEMRSAIRKYDISLPDSQLACAPVHSKEGEAYFKAMACAANYAWANRQMICHWVRESFEKVFGRKAEDMGMSIVYDVAHNIAKLEEHEHEGKRVKLYIHRKGATRAFAKGREELAAKYRDVGQPVIIPGDMGTASYVLVGTETAMKESWGSTCHGAGRVMSRKAAVRRFRPAQVRDLLNSRGIYVRSATKEGLTEEAPDAYKDIDHVVRICQGAGITKMVARMKPIGVMKG